MAGIRTFISKLFPYHYGSYKSSPPLTVQEHGPVHRKDQRSDPEQELFRMTNWVGSYNLTSWLLRGSPSWRSQPCVPGWFSGHCVRRCSSAHHFPGWSSRHSILPKAAIHTTMVLTQRTSGQNQAQYKYCFHTTMVLTQHAKKMSITRCTKQFPYHYGSYATYMGHKGNALWICSFHTTMVLTQRPKRVRKYGDGGIVSIPLWFLRNGTIWERVKETRDTFPYHYGSYATF